MTLGPGWTTPVEQAKKAIENGISRGRFLREAMRGGADWLELQEWSWAYSDAIKQLRAAKIAADWTRV